MKTTRNPSIRKTGVRQEIVSTPTRPRLISHRPAATGLGEEGQGAQHRLSARAFL